VECELRDSGLGNLGNKKGGVLTTLIKSAKVK